MLAIAWSSITYNVELRIGLFTAGKRAFFTQKPSSLELFSDGLSYYSLETRPGARSIEDDKDDQGCRSGEDMMEIYSPGFL